MKRIGCILLGICLLVAAGCGGTPQGSDDRYDPNHGVDPNGRLLTLAENGTSSYRIVTPNEGTACEAFAAQELRDFLRASTGAELPIVTDASVAFSPRSKFISVGETKLWQQAGCKSEDSALKLDGFVLKTEGETLFIRGARDKGTLFGVYDFLEKFAGVRFFTPEVTKVPALDTLAVREMDVTEIPAINVRNYYAPEVDRDELYTTRLRMVSLYGTARAEYGYGMYRDLQVYAHNTMTLVPYEQYKDDPNFFYQSENPALGYDICMSYGLTPEGEPDPEVPVSPYTVVVESLKKQIVEYPEATYFSVCQMDMPDGCKCERCRARSTTERGGRSNILIRFLNAVSKALDPWMKENYPDRPLTLVTFAYAYNLQPPLNAAGEWTVTPRDNVCIWLAMSPNYAYPINDDRQPISTKSLIRQWSEKAGAFFYWDYRVNFREYLFYMPGLTTMQQDLSYLAEIGTEYAFLQAASGAPTDNSNWLSDLKAYVASKLMWNPGRDVPALIREYCEGVYGGSAEVVLGMIEKFEDNYERLRRDESVSDSFGIDHEFGYNTLGEQWYPRNLLTGSVEALEAEIARVEADDSLTEAQRKTFADRLICVLLTPQKMLLRNYQKYFENDYTGEVALAKQFVANCERVGATQDLGGYGNTFESFKEKYGL